MNLFCAAQSGDKDGKLDGGGGHFIADLTFEPVSEGTN